MCSMLSRGLSCTEKTLALMRVDRLAEEDEVLKGDALKGDELALMRVDRLAEEDEVLKGDALNGVS
jgi:hypothetical protein